MTTSVTFTAELWLYPGKAAWHFITLPKETAETLEFYHAHQKQGWGSLPVTVQIGATTWNTSIFPDKKSSSFFLPVKAAVRTAEQLSVGDNVTVSLSVRL